MGYFLIPPLVSAALMVVYLSFGEGSPRARILVGAVFAVALYLQFVAGGRWPPVVGLVAQSTLAIFLILQTTARRF